MVEQQDEYIKYHEQWLNERCKCAIKIPHKHGEHDWCCQICGGNHVERICPYKGDKE